MANFKNQASFQHQCPNCGAALKYDPSSGRLVCEHCKSQVDFTKDANVEERDFKQLVTFNTWKESDIACYRCGGCGAEVVAPRTTLATNCPYCGSPIVIEDKTGSLVKPNTVVPFELTSAQAAEKLTAWRSKKLFAPNKFRKKTDVDSIKGLFVPVWTFDAKTSSHYDGTVGYHRTRTVRRNGKTYTESYTEWRHVSGIVNLDFDDILVKANDNISEADFRRLGPYSQSKYMVYDDEYLAGYIADHYSLEPLDAFARAKGVMEADIRHEIRRLHDADVEGSMRVDLGIVDKSFKYMLVPVYIASTRYGGKLFNQYVSGVYSDTAKQNTRICGKTPISPWKVLLTVLLCLALVVGLALLVIDSNGGFEQLSQVTQTLQITVAKAQFDLPNCTQYCKIQISK